MSSNRVHKKATPINGPINTISHNPHDVNDWLMRDSRLYVSGVPAGYYRSLSEADPSGTGLPGFPKPVAAYDLSTTRDDKLKNFADATGATDGTLKPETDVIDNCDDLTDWGTGGFGNPLDGFTLDDHIGTNDCFKVTRTAGNGSIVNLAQPTQSPKLDFTGKASITFWYKTDTPSATHIIFVKTPVDYTSVSFTVADTDWHQYTILLADLSPILDYDNVDYIMFRETYSADDTTRSFWVDDITVGIPPTPDSATGPRGTGMAFDADYGQYVDCGDNFDVATDDFTLATSMSCTDTSGGAMPIVNKMDSGGVGYKVDVNTSGYVVLTIGDGVDTYTATGSTAIDDDSAHDIIINIDRDVGVTISVDNSYDAVTPVGTIGDVDTLTNSDSFLIGSDGTDYLDGDVYEFCKYRLLSSDEVATLSAMMHARARRIYDDSFDDAVVIANSATEPTSTSSARYGDVMDFDGVDDEVLVSLDDDYYSASGNTIMVLMKPDAYDDTYIALGRQDNAVGHDFVLGVATGGNIAVTIGVGDGSTVETKSLAGFTAGKWVAAFATIESDSITITACEEGSAPVVSTQSLTGTRAASQSGISSYIGRVKLAADGTSLYPFDGQIAAVGIWDRTFSENVLRNWARNLVGGL